MQLALCCLLLATAAAAQGSLLPAAHRRSPARPALIEPFSEHLHSGPHDDGTAFIYGGEDAGEGDFPYQAALFDDTRGFFCSGTILSEGWIVTAGHCVDWTSSDIVVRVGLYRLDQTGSDIQARRTTLALRTIHPHYNPDFLDNDIAVIKLPQTVKLQKGLVERVLLPRYADAARSLSGETVVISGWGRVSDSGSWTSNILQFAELKLSANKECEDVYGNAVIGTKLCANTEAGVSTCKGDSGGPIVHQVGRRSYLWGIVSFGSSKGCTVGRPVVFTRVTSFLEFVETTTGLPVAD